MPFGSSPFVLEKLIRSNQYIFVIPNMANMVAESVVNIPQIPTNVALIQMVSEQVGTEEIDDTSSQGQIDTITTLIRLIFFHLKKQQDLTNNLIAASTAASGVDSGIPAEAPTTTPITENAATVTVVSSGTSTMYHDSKVSQRYK